MVERWLPVSELPVGATQRGEDWVLWTDVEHTQIQVFHRYPTTPEAVHRVLDTASHALDPDQARKLADAGTEFNGGVDFLLSRGLDLQTAIRETQRSNRDVLGILVQGYFQAFAGAVSALSTAIEHGATVDDLVDRAKAQTKAWRATRGAGLLGSEDEREPQIPTIRERPAATEPWIAKEQPLVDGKPVAFVNGKPVRPDVYGTRYYGTDQLTMEEILKNGLPEGGTNWDLVNHAEQGGNSAFRGTTLMLSAPVIGGETTGAAEWGGEGSVVVEITGMPGWDVNAQLHGRVKTFVGYRGNIMTGEGEFATPARVPLDNISQVGVVSRNARGRFVVMWTANPNFKGTR
jgi:hypothetical protein